MEIGGRNNHDTAPEQAPALTAAASLLRGQAAALHMSLRRRTAGADGQHRAQK